MMKPFWVFGMPSTNARIPFLHINHLIEAKKAANRPKDQVDVLALEKIKLIRDSDWES